MSDHAIFSPSGSATWLNCPGSIAAQEGIVERPSKYADEGTAAHTIGSMILENNWDYDQLMRLVGEVGVEVNGVMWPLTQDMAEHCWDYASLVWEYAKGGQLLVEQKVDFSRVIGQESAFGTSDAIIIKPTEIIVIDLKYGMGEEVVAEGNTQCLLYALGALEAHDLVYDFQNVVMVIHQVRLNSVTEWVQSVAEVRAFGEKAKTKAALTQEPDAPRIKGDKQCRWCTAKASAKGLCPALTGHMDESVIDDFKGIGTGIDLVPVIDDKLAYYMDNLDLIEHFAKAVRAEVERRLVAGIAVPGYKLVQGKMGNRAWVDDTEAEAALKKLRLKVDEMYTKKVITPPAAEKLLKKQRPKLWDKLQGLITRSEGKPSVAPVTDKSPAISLVATPADFAAIVDASAEGLC